MATRLKGGFLLPLMLVGGAIVYLGGTEVVDKVAGLFNADPVIVGTGDERLLVADGAQSKVVDCTPHRVLAERQCGDLKVVIINATRMPYIARNISLAWGEGKPFVLTRSGEPRDKNYQAACGSFAKKYDDGSCDEYAFASTRQGGNNARTEEVPNREQDCQGGTIGAAYRWQGIKAGSDFLVVISNPEQVASGAYQGQDIAEDTATCES